LPKKEATAAAPPAYQWQHQLENVYKSRRLDLFNLSTVSREFSDYQVVSLKKIAPFFAMYILVDASLYVFGRWLSKVGMAQNLRLRTSAVCAPTKTWWNPQIHTRHHLKKMFPPVCLRIRVSICELKKLQP
jgi:hypothetical protein